MRKKVELQHVVFDVGGVLVFHDNEKMISQLSKLMTNPPCSSYLLEQIRASGIGVGSKTLEDLFENFRRQYGGDAVDQAWLKAWTCHFSPNTPLLRFLQSSAFRETGIAICSNTNSEHWRYLDTRYCLSELTSKHVLSFEVGFEKPDPSIFEYLADFLRSAPELVLFVDDRMESLVSRRIILVALMHS
jgi:glucose-1-phosphatase